MHYQRKLTQSELLTDALRHVSYDFGLQTLSTLQGALSFTLGLLTHELVVQWSLEEWSNRKFVSWLVFMIIAFIFPKVRDFYSHGCCKGIDEDETQSSTMQQVRPKGNTTHSSYYIT